MTEVDPTLVGTIGGVAVIVVALWLLPIVRVRRFQRRNPDKLTPVDILKGENDTRTNLAQIIGGAAVLFGLYFTSETFRLQQRGQLVDRINKAIEQLSSDKLDLNLGGIYQLGRIAADSERDRWPMIQVLMAHVERSAPMEKWLSCDPMQPFNRAGTPDQKVQSIVRILREQNPGVEGASRRVSMVHANFNYVDFSGAKLQGAVLASDDLRGAILADTDLEGVVLNYSLLNNANLSRSNLAAAHLQRTCFLFSQLTGADLRNAHLEEADLRDVVDASGANFAGATLDGANFSGVDLTNAKGFTALQLAKANIDCETKLPPDLTGIQSSLKCANGDQ